MYKLCNTLCNKLCNKLFDKIIIKLNLYWLLIKCKSANK